jgi:hypothetical protein
MSESERAPRRITICQFCRKRVYQTRDGAWYHRGNGSTSCRPGEGSERRALPIEIEVKAREAAER